MPLQNETPMSEKQPWWYYYIRTNDFGFPYVPDPDTAIPEIISTARNMALEEAMEGVRKRIYPTDNSESLFRQGYNEACNDILEALNKLK